MSSIERCNSGLKENLNLDNIRSAGVNKAIIFALLSCISLVSPIIAINLKFSKSKKSA